MNLETKVVTITTKDLDQKITEKEIKDALESTHKYSLLQLKEKPL